MITGLVDEINEIKKELDKKNPMLSSYEVLAIAVKIQYNRIYQEVNCANQASLEKVMAVVTDGKSELKQVGEVYDIENKE